MGHAGEGMSDLCDGIKGDVWFRKGVAQVFVQNPGYWTEWSELRSPDSALQYRALACESCPNVPNPVFRKAA